MILATKLFVFVTPHSRIFHSHIDVTKSDTNCKSYVTSTSQRRTLVKEQSPSMLNALRLGAGIKKKPPGCEASVQKLCYRDHF